MDEKPKRPWLKFGGDTLCVAVILLGIVLLIWVRGHSYTIASASYTEACTTSLIRIFVPPQARNITAWVRPGQMGITAAFEISEADFVAWAATQGWELKDVVNIDVPNTSANADPNDSKHIAAGLLYERPETPTGGGIRKYVYDKAKQIGYFTQL